MNRKDGKRRLTSFCRYRRVVPAVGFGPEGDALRTVATELGLDPAAAIRAAVNVLDISQRRWTGERACRAVADGLRRAGNLEGGKEFAVREFHAEFDLGPTRDQVVHARMAMELTEMRRRLVPDPVISDELAPPSVRVAAIEKLVLDTGAFLNFEAEFEAWLVRQDDAAALALLEGNRLARTDFDERAVRLERMLMELRNVEDEPESDS